jgi:hypothetical protein
MRRLNVAVIALSPPLSLSSSSHYIVIIVSMRLLLPLQLPFQLIGFSYYSMVPQHCGLQSISRTILYLIQEGSARAKKKKKKEKKLDID